MNDTANILTVEDDEDINRLLCDIIYKNGYYPKYTQLFFIFFLFSVNLSLL
ncbi:hypothetical protein V7146_23925 [Gottfriedia acidiceleris]|uniref:hypothetical protein n=1 Tax=Gottfriedia acidiceleris TaxID=371036 RepID=UPI002FFFAF34